MEASDQQTRGRPDYEEGWAFSRTVMKWTAMKIFLFVNARLHSIDLLLLSFLDTYTENLLNSTFVGP